MSQDRRTFVAALAIGVPAVQSARHLSIGTPPALDHALLVTVAEAVLPTMSPADLEGAARGFAAWLDAFPSHAERNHGYGTADLTFLGPTPAARWAGQLQALDRDGRDRFGIRLPDASVDQRRTVVREALEGVSEALPHPTRADHVVVGLAWYAATPGATNRCYEAEINPRTCRPLQQSPRRPAPSEDR